VTVNYEPLNTPREQAEQENARWLANWKRQQARYAGKSWPQVLEENEWFDGEPEITASAKAAWREVNRRAA
jgi:hypothetical protein